MACAGTAPMVFLRRILNQSSVMPIFSIGWKMAPISKFCDVSGVRVLFPPNNPIPCWVQVVLVNGARAGLTRQFGFPVPRVPPVEADRLSGLYRSNSVGARKPVEAVP